MCESHYPLPLSQFEAVALYDSQLVKWGAKTLANEDLLNVARQTADASQLTCYESQLCRSLRKPPSAQKPAVEKYTALYATVPTASVLPQLLAGARAVLKGKEEE